MPWGKNGEMGATPKNRKKREPAITAAEVRGVDEQSTGAGILAQPESGSRQAEATCDVRVSNPQTMVVRNLTDQMEIAVSGGDLNAIVIQNGANMHEKMRSWIDVLRQSKRTSWADESPQSTGNLSVNNEPIDGILTSTGLCLEYVPPSLVNGKVVTLMEHDDIESKLEFWKSSLACYVLGANPPFTVMEGFLKRIWGQKGVERVISKGNGIFIVHFESVLERDEILKRRIYF